MTVNQTWDSWLDELYVTLVQPPRRFRFTGRYVLGLHPSVLRHFPVTVPVPVPFVYWSQRIPDGRPMARVRPYVPSDWNNTLSCPMEQYGISRHVSLEWNNRLSCCAMFRRNGTTQCFVAPFSVGMEQYSVLLRHVPSEWNSTLACTTRLRGGPWRNNNFTPRRQQELPEASFGLFFVFLSRRTRVTPLI